MWSPRFVFKRGMIESFEISGYMLAACIGLGLAFTVTSKSNTPGSMSCSMLLIAACSLALVIAVALVWSSRVCGP